MLIAVVFPVVGLAFVSLGVRKGLTGGRLLRDGRQAPGVLISTEPTNTKINDQTVFKYAFQFTTDERQAYTVVAKTHLTDRFAGEKRWARRRSA